MASPAGSSIHLRNREYDPRVGAFTSTDPLVGVDGTPVVANQYHYANNDPLNQTDPLGLRPSDDDFGTTPFDDPCFRSTGVPGQLHNPDEDHPGCWALEVTGTGRGGANPAEWAYCWPGHLPSCRTAEGLADRARAEAARRFGGEDQDYYANGYGVDYPGGGGSAVEGVPTDGSPGNAFQHMVWNGLMVEAFGYDRAKGFADRHETDSYTRNWLFFRGMDFANNFYGRELADHLLDRPRRNFDERLFDEAERFVRAGLACTVSNFETASRGSTGEPPVYVDPSRCGLR
jgi:RHS repeat-associated protein